MLGDCLERMKEIPDNSIDLVLTDPPYGTTKCKWDTVIPFEPIWEQLKRITKDNGAICLFGSEPFSSALRMSNIKMFKYDWIWDKGKAGNFAQANRQPLKRHEIISVFYKKQCLYNAQKTKLEKPQVRHLGKRSENRSDRKKSGGIGGQIKYSSQYEPDKKNPISIINFKKDNYRGSVFHPTQKPVALLEYLIKTYTLENETVLDFTMGSGSTGVACKNVNRNFIGIEKDKEYFKIAEHRIISVI